MLTFSPLFFAPDRLLSPVPKELGLSGAAGTWVRLWVHTIYSYCNLPPYHDRRQSHLVQIPRLTGVQSS